VTVTTTSAGDVGPRTTRRGGPIDDGVAGITAARLAKMKDVKKAGRGLHASK
jgi:hypothetical protein